MSTQRPAEAIERLRAVVQKNPEHPEHGWFQCQECGANIGDLAALLAYVDAMTRERVDENAFLARVAKTFCEDWGQDGAEFLADLTRLLVDTRNIAIAEERSSPGPGEVETK